ncbi:hypothetical protein CEP52_016716 [Fusarium oligoseptatum]|uniref:Uncharacterized protein n=1 Tax=Fusarium oligoseptatum TaxID=2604345 RepID=A0A428S134_9HYPO|nr:hypothetical protein CEP52_016716 [Fusarium oligoseptatum]
MNEYDNMTINPIETVGGCINLCRIEEVIDNRGMTMLMNAGWNIISNWMDDVPKISVDSPIIAIPRVSYRLGRRFERIIVQADIIVGMPDDVVVNIDADRPGRRPVRPRGQRVVAAQARDVGRVRPASGGRPGLVSCADAPPFWIVGLDIETREEGGQARQREDPVFIKTRMSEAAVVKAHKIISILSPDFVIIYNGFGFDMKRLAAHSSKVETLGTEYERRRLGNSGTGAVQYVRRDWDSISLANIGMKLGLPPKLDMGVDDMMVEVSEKYDVSKMLIYNARDLDFTRVGDCEFIYMLAGSSRSTI